MACSSGGASDSDIMTELPKYCTVVDTKKNRIEICEGGEIVIGDQYLLTKDNVICGKLDYFNGVCSSGGRKLEYINGTKDRRIDQNITLKENFDLFFDNGLELLADGKVRIGNDDCMGRKYDKATDNDGKITIGELCEDSLCMYELDDNNVAEVSIKGDYSVFSLRICYGTKSKVLKKVLSPKDTICKEIVNPHETDGLSPSLHFPLRKLMAKAKE